MPTPVGPIIRMFFGSTSSRSLLVELLPAPAVAQRDGDGALGVVLADDVAVELGDDFARGEVGHLASGSLQLRICDGLGSAATTSLRCVLRHVGARCHDFKLSMVTLRLV